MSRGERAPLLQERHSEDSESRRVHFFEIVACMLANIT